MLFLKPTAFELMQKDNQSFLNMLAIVNAFKNCSTQERFFLGSEIMELFNLRKNYYRALYTYLDKLNDLGIIVYNKQNTKIHVYLRLVTDYYTITKGSEYIINAGNAIKQELCTMYGDCTVYPKQELSNSSLNYILDSSPDRKVFLTDEFNLDLVLPDFNLLYINNGKKGEMIFIQGK